MKKIKIIALGVLAFITIASTVFVSCTKRATNTESNVDETLSMIQRLKSNYTLNTSDLAYKQKSFFDFACDDIMGAGAGIAWGSVAGPFGSFCGGVSLGCYMSVRDYDGMVVPNPVNPTEKLRTISNNPFDYLGYIHNKTLKAILDNHSAYMTNKSLDISKYYNFTYTYFKTFPEFSKYNLQQSTLITYYKNISSIYTGNFSEGCTNLNIRNLITLNSKNILIEFWTVIKSINSNTDRIKYYKDFVNVINASTLSENEKRIILGTSSVGIYSVLFNSANV
jgi:hypothetical protein